MNGTENKRISVNTIKCSLVFYILSCLKDSKVSKGECSPTSKDAPNIIEDNVSLKGNINE